MTIVAKVGLKGIDPTFATGIRNFFMFLFMLGLITFTGKLKGFNTLDTNAVLTIIISAVFGALSWLCYFLALRKTGDATKVAALDRLSLAFILVLSIAFLAENSHGEARNRHAPRHRGRDRRGDIENN